jgi:hypothetical protein
MDLAPAPAAIEFGRFRVLPHRRGPLAAQWGSARLARWCRPTLAPDRLATAWTAKCPSFVARSLLANDRNRRISAFDGSRRRAANHPLYGRSLRGRNNRSWAACVPGIPSLRPRTTRRWQRPPGLPALPSALPINCCSCSRGGSGAALARHRPLPILRDGREPDSRPGRSRRWISLYPKTPGSLRDPPQDRVAGRVRNRDREGQAEAGPVFGSFHTDGRLSCCPRVFCIQGLGRG